MNLGGNKMVDVLIKKLIERTENGKYEWKCISECIEDNCNLINNSLRKFIIGNNKSYYNKRNYYTPMRFLKKYAYNSWDDFIYYPLSYTLDIEGGVITLLTYCDAHNERYYKLVAQNTPNGNPGIVNIKDEYQEELLQLLKTIKYRNDNVDTIIKKIIGNS